MNFSRFFAVLALAAIPLTPGHADTVIKSVPANKSSVIGSFGGFIRHTCRSIGLPDAVVRQRPTHGDLRIEQQRGISKSDLCKGTEQRYLVFVYTPRKGFKGADRISIDIPWRSHEHAPMAYLTETFEVTVN